jgi:hypothetical protein
LAARAPRAMSLIDGGRPASRSMSQPNWGSPPRAKIGFGLWNWGGSLRSGATAWMRASRPAQPTPASADGIARAIAFAMGEAEQHHRARWHTRPVLTGARNARTQIPDDDANDERPAAPNSGVPSASHRRLQF